MGMAFWRFVNFWTTIDAKGREGHERLTLAVSFHAFR